VGEYIVVTELRTLGRSDLLLRRNRSTVQGHLTSFSRNFWHPRIASGQTMIWYADRAYDLAIGKFPQILTLNY